MFWIDDKQEIKNTEIPYITDISKVDYILLVGVLSPIDIWSLLEDKIKTDSQGKYFPVKRKKIRKSEELAAHYLLNCKLSILRDRAIKELLEQVEFK